MAPPCRTIAAPPACKTLPYLVVVMAIALCGPAIADTYKCRTASGGLSIQDTPCHGPGTTTLSVASDPGVSQKQREDNDRRWDRARDYMDRNAAEEDAIRQRREAHVTAVQAADAKARDEAAARKKANDCAELVAKAAGQRVLSNYERDALNKDCRKPGVASGGTAIPAPAAPDFLVNCDPAGCWGTSGMRYNNTGPGGPMMRSDGKVCTGGGGTLSCN